MANQGGNLKSTSINGCRTYYITGQRSNATWLDPKKIRALRKDTDYQQRVELVQDLRFETATTRIKVSPDGDYLIASGIYPPQVKVYELREMALKFERHLISEIVDFEILSDDYSKMAFLCADRSINLHAKYGSHFSLRVPRMGRDLAYDPWSCDLLCAASSPELYRINLEQFLGRFLSSLSTRSPALNVVTRSKLHGLIACGGADGAVECFDFRTKSSVGRINSAEHAGDTNQEVTALQFDGDGGYQMAVGTSDGKVLVYDLRSSHPTRVKDHMYGSPILDIKWHQTLNSEGTKLITTDSHIVRIWDPETGDNITSIEPTGGTINDICVFDKSGLMLLALDGMQIPCYFTPALGPAPKWCSYLEHLTEELEENPQATIYDDFKFLTSEELERLNLTNLIGTNLLRAYMHGYFIDYRLYKKAKSLAKPFEYEQYIEDHKKKKLEEQRGSRITKKLPRLPKVNPKVAHKFLLDGEAEEDNVEVDDGADKKKKRKKGLGAEIMKDDRFNQMFENKDFEVEEQSQEYLSLHPMPSSKRKPQQLVEEHFVPVDEDLRSSDSDSSEAAASSDDGLNKGQRKKARLHKLYEAKDERHATAFVDNRSLANDDILPIGERVAALSDHHSSHSSRDVKLGPGGSREISFISRSSAKYKEDKEEEREGKRRGIQSLGFQSDRLDSGGRGRGRGGRGRGGGRGGGGRGRGGRGGGGGFRGKSRGRGGRRGG